MDSGIQSLEQLYNEMNLKHTTAQPSTEFISFQESPNSNSMDPFSAPAVPTSPATSNPFRSVPSPMQPSFSNTPAAPHTPQNSTPLLGQPQSPPSQNQPALDGKHIDSTNSMGQMNTYFERMTKMMLAMDDRLTRLESLMSHNLYLLHQQQQQQQQYQLQQQQQQPPQKARHTQEEDVESALKEQVKAELEQLKKAQALYEKDGEIAKKIQAQLDDEYFVEERKKFYSQPAPAHQQPKPKIPGYDECPLCQVQFKVSELEGHVYSCLDGDKNIASDGTKKVVDKPGFLARLFGTKTTEDKEKQPLVTAHAQPAQHAEYPPHHGMYPAMPAPGTVPGYPPMYPMPSSPYMGAVPPQMYYYLPPAHNPSQ